MIRSLHIIFLLVLLVLAPSKVLAQDVMTMLNGIASVFNNRQEELYDDAETYLLSLDKDSIENNIHTEILYHSAMAFLYAQKYKDWEKSRNELSYVLSKYEPIKHLPEFCESYRSLLSAYGYSLWDSGHEEEAIKYFNKVLIDGFDDEYDKGLYDTYYALANMYDKTGDVELSKDCHNKCQEFLVKSYIHNHPEHTFYLDNYKTLKYAISQSEQNNKNNTEEYINNLCSLGYLLHLTDQGEFWEAMRVLIKAHGCAIDNHLLNAKGLEECYVGLQDIFIKYIPEPTKTQMVEGLVPYMISFFSGIMEPWEVYESVATSYGANQQYEKSIEYELKVLDIIKKDANNNKDRLKKIYKNLVTDYLNMNSDSTNLVAYEYIQKYKNLIHENELDYEWYLDNHPIILRYLYKVDEAIKLLKSNLAYYNKKYGKSSEQYISTLNQLALCYPFESETYLSILLEAQKLSEGLAEIPKTTIRALSVNIARHYIQNGKFDEAKRELDLAAAIEMDVLGEVLPLTQSLIEQCSGK